MPHSDGDVGSDSEDADEATLMKQVRKHKRKIERQADRAKRGKTADDDSDADHSDKGADDDSDPIMGRTRKSESESEESEKDEWFAQVSDVSQVPTAPQVEKSNACGADEQNRWRF